MKNICIFIVHFRYIPADIIIVQVVSLKLNTLHVFLIYLFWTFRFYCELFFDKVIYAKTSSKPKSDILFWGENFAFKWVKFGLTMMKI